jgi:hypothetical protein
MKTFSYKTAKLAFLGLVVIMANSSTINAQSELAPDQNPNYKKSMDKYMAEKDELLKNQGKTIQATYKAIDDMELKQERKAQRITYRQERRLARINNRGRSRGYYSPYYSSYNPYGYNYGSNYGYNNYGYNNFGYNNGYSPVGYTPYYGLGNTIGTVASTALLGLGAYWLFHH